MTFPKFQTIARVWKYSLGSFSDDKTQPYDNCVAIIRSIIFVSYLITNCFIVAGVIRHWDNRKSVPPTVDGSGVGVLYYEGNQGRV